MLWGMHSLSLGRLSADKFEISDVGPRGRVHKVSSPRTDRWLCVSEEPLQRQLGEVEGTEVRFLSSAPVTSF